ncbi:MULTISPECIES: hypothetical protein [Catenuloplanes]|uniref:OAA-family lectin sugar binding domain-containing protein n=1 Tax=Catenuloplanes niger TaxID=587534 RepID=A0AAE4CW72_9ACTN|nr:hypothetical protein [Catenuloplanes niger]MDR7326920.1 hypothetical protein [Catenuloplanes niger]
MEPTYVSFAQTPPLTGNAELTVEGGHPAGGHLALGAGGSVTMTFQVPAENAHLEATLRIVALVSELGGEIGYAPLDVTVGGQPVVRDWRIPGGGDLPQRMDFAFPAGMLSPGANTLRLTSGAGARSMLWLYRVTVDSVWERDRSAHALDRHAAEKPLLRYATRTLAGRGWQPGPPVLAYVGTGRHSPLAQLAWADSSGAEYAVTLTGELHEFYGWCRPPGSTAPREFRGDLAGRWDADDAGSGATVRTFEVEAGWGGGWHRAGHLDLAVGVAGVRLTRVSWRDQHGNNGTVAFDGRGDGFVGTHQTVGEGAVGYRGRAPVTVKG